MCLVGSERRREFRVVRVGALGQWFKIINQIVDTIRC